MSIARGLARSSSDRKHPPKASVYLPDAGRRRGLVSTTEQSGVFFEHPDELHQGLDAEVGERHDAVFADAIDPDDAVLRIHSIGDIPQPVLVFTEILCDATDRGDGMNFVDVHDYAA